MAISRNSLITSTGLAGLLLAGLGAASMVATAQDLAGGNPVSAGSARHLMIEDFVGIIEVRNGPAFDYRLEMAQNVVPEPEIEISNGSLKVLGGLEKGPERCNQNNRKFEMQMRGGDKLPISAFPTLIITAPEGTSMDVSVLGGLVTIGDSSDLSLDFKGCGDARFGNVAQNLNLAIYGSGDVTGGNSGAAEIMIKGSGDVSMADIRGDAVIDISGSGDVTIGEISGSSRLKIKGSGDIDIASIASDSDVDLRGSGDIEIARGDVSEFKVNVMGSGDVQFNGGADDVSVLLKGSGDVYVARSNGNRVVSRYGSGDVRIGSWRYDDD